MNETSSTSCSDAPRPLRRGEYALIFGVLAVVFAWTFGQDLIVLADAWERRPDYSHGYLVIPVALAFLWVRRDQFPGLRPSWFGLVVLAFCLAVRFAGQRLFLVPLSGWSLILWVSAACWLMGGRRLFHWSLPAILFLLFMVPLPHRSEFWISAPIQRASTLTSSWLLQLAGQPALAEGNIIFLDTYQLEVAQACSGLRTLVGVAALAFAMGVFSRQSRGGMLVLLMSVTPIAVMANSLRIVATSLAYRYVANQPTKDVLHDYAGWIAIAVAALLIWLLLVYCRRLFIPLEQVSEGKLLREKMNHSAPANGPTPNRTRRIAT